VSLQTLPDTHALVLTDLATHSTRTRAVYCWLQLPVPGLGTLAGMAGASELKRLGLFQSLSPYLAEALIQFDPGMVELNGHLTALNAFAEYGPKVSMLTLSGALAYCAKTSSESSFRHHCRGCGRSLCGQCLGSRYAPVAKECRGLHRVCVHCYLALANR
jgi:hypothetical protein